MAGGIFYNSVSQNGLFYNNVEQSGCFYNNTEVWKKDLQLHPGQTWEYSVNQNDGGAGRGANASLSDANTMTLIGGYDGSSAFCAKRVDISHWTTLTFTFSYTSLSHFQFRWGVYSQGTTNIYGINEIRVTKHDGISGDYAGSFSINVADLSGAVYVMVYLYAGSSLAGNQVNITNVTLS